MGKAAEMRQIIVDGKVYRGERYPYRSCSEWLIRGPFAGGTAFKPDGSPKWFNGSVSAFKVVGNVARQTDKRFSKKAKGEALLDWRPFAEALGYEVV
jgi:hypothetical protein